MWIIVVQLKNPPKYVSYVITSRCVANCDICLTPSSDPEGKFDLNTEEAKEVLKTIKNLGTEMVSFAGREPFLRKDIWELIDYAKNIGLKLNIESTALTLNKKDIDKLIQYKVDWLSMTVDSLNHKLSSTMRRPFVSKEKLELLCSKFGASKNSHLKVSTVISKITRDQVNQIGEVLSKKPPEVWKLRQFTLRGKGNRKHIIAAYDISSKDFDNIYALLCRAFPKLYITISRKDDYIGALLMITPRGKVTIPMGKESKVIGNLLKDKISLKKVWAEEYDESMKKLHKRNYYISYIKPLEINKNAKA